MNLDAVRNTIIVGAAEEVLPRFPERSIPLFFFSPPYNLGNTSGGGEPAARMGHYADDAPMGRARGGMGMWNKASLPGGLSDGYDGTEDALPHADYCAWLADVLRGCWKACSGAIFFNHKPRVLNGALVTPLDYVPPDLRPFVRQEVIWARAGGINFSPAFYLPTHERIVILARPEWRLKSKGASGMGDVWYVPQESDTWHPAPFPEALPARALESTAAPLVCDPFMGSGTTGKAARRMGRDFIGVEKSAAYAARATREIATAEGRDLGDAALSPLELWAASQDAA